MILAASVVLASVLAAAPAKKLAVPDLDSKAGVPASVAQAVNVLLPTEVRRASGAKHVIAQAEIVSMLGFEKERALAGCTETGCLAEIGGALGVDELISSRLAVAGTTFVLEVARLDVRRARTLGSVTRMAAGEQALLEAVKSAVDELFAVPAPMAIAAPAAATTKEAAPERSTGLTVAMLAGGGVLTAAGATGIVYARLIASEYEAQQKRTVKATVTRAEADRATLIYGASIAGAAVGLTALGFGAYRLFSNGETEVAVSPQPNGILLAGSF